MTRLSSKTEKGSLLMRHIPAIIHFCNSLFFGSGNHPQKCGFYLSQPPKTSKIPKIPKSSKVKIMPLTQILLHRDNKNTGTVQSFSPMTFYTLTLVYLVLLVLAMVFSCWPPKSHAEEHKAPDIIVRKHKDTPDPLSFKEDETQSTPQSRAESEQHRQLLYTLLVAEMAASRNNPNLALNQYLQAAQKSKDAAIAEHATQLAVQYQAAEAAVMAAEMWAQYDPKDLQAQMVASTLLIGQSIEKTLPYLTRAIIIGPEEVNQNIVNIQSRLSEKSADNLRQAFDRIAKARPQDSEAQVAAALTAATMGDIPNANAWVDAALKIQPDLTKALELKAKLIRHQDSSDKNALSFLNENVEKFPKNTALRMFYASALLDANRLSEAKNHLKLLTEDKTFGGKALIYLAEISTQEEDLKDAHERLKKALDFAENKNNAQYLLGELAEKQGKNEEAIRWYAGVNPGPYHVPATLRGALLLKNQKEYTKAIALLHDSSPTTLEEQKMVILFEVDILSNSKQLEDAYALISHVLAKLPNDADVLLAHSLVAIELKHWDAAELDLQTILGKDPRNAAALNALGYTLSLQKEKQAEAKKYMLQALEIAPNNAAYLDTLGWFDYRMGNYSEALVTLKKAHELSKDPEITAHLGELLFVIGQREEAMVLLNQALEQNPDHDLLNETIGRLKVDLKPSVKVVKH